MILGKSEGSTPSERYLARLCQRTFLSLWSYPNLFRDQGRKDGKGAGKEICDLLVVFGNDVIIFSDKSCEFPRTGDIKTDWGRWYKRAIKKSADQVFGAERWLTQQPDRVFVDQACKQKFPLELPDSSKRRFHRIVVALNASERCREHLGGSGSLIIAPGPIGGASSADIPFFVGNVAPNRGFVHVVDDVTLDIVLKELDTVADFVAYLRRKEDFITSGRLASVAGEEDLLSFYLRDIDDSGDHAFIVPPDADYISIDQGFWQDFLTRPEYIAKKQADRISYAWDALIESFSAHAANGTLVYGQDIPLSQHEQLLRVMAAENRTKRRSLAEALVGKIRDSAAGRAHGWAIDTRVMLQPTDGTDLAYVFMVFGGPESGQGEEYRHRRRLLLQAYCMIVKGRYRGLKRVVGIAVEPPEVRERSEDLLYMDVAHWSKQDYQRAEFLRKQLNLRDAASLTPHHFTVQEYPDASDVADAATTRRRERNRRKRQRRKRPANQRRR
jgi:hypothetical protein